MNYVIATSRPWNEVLVQRLEEATGDRFYLINRKEDLTVERLREINPRYVFFPHWSYLIPTEVHTAYECVIFHMTDLPYGRGGSPLQNLILRGHATTQISALRCVEEVDAVLVYFKRPLSLEGSASEIFIRAAGVIESMITNIVRDAPEPEPQVGEPVVFKRRSPDQSDLGLASIHSLNDFFDFIRMLDAQWYPKAFLEVRGHRVELSRVQLEHGRLVGTFVVYRQESLPIGNGTAGGGVKTLLDRCYPKSPRDVFERMLGLYKPGDPIYTVETDDSVIGMVYLARHSKGGHLEGLALDPEYQGFGLADRLVETLVTDNPGVISLTTRIPAFFDRHGFRDIESLADQSHYMLRIPTQ